MSEEEEYFQASSSTKLLTGDSDFSVTESTSIRNPETNSSAEEVIKPEKLSSLLTDLSQSLLPDQEKDQSNHSSANESEKETKDQSEADSNPIEKENCDFLVLSTKDIDTVIIPDEIEIIENFS